MTRCRRQKTRFAAPTALASILHFGSGEHAPPLFVELAANGLSTEANSVFIDHTAGMHLLIGSRKPSKLVQMVADRVSLIVRSYMNITTKHTLYSAPLGRVLAQFITNITLLLWVFPQPLKIL